MKKCIVNLSGVNNVKLLGSVNNKYSLVLKTKSIMIAPGGSHPVKYVPEELIISIVNRLISSVSSPFKIYLAGDSNDYELCKRIKDALEVKTAIENFAGRADWSEVLTLLSKSSVVLSTDSAIMHLVNYLNIPGLTLLGPTVEGFGYVSYTENNKVFSHILSCRPCSKNGDNECAYRDKLCYYKLDWEEIVNYLGKHLI